MAPTTRNKPTGSGAASTPGDRVDAGQKPALLAGFLSLPNVTALKELLAYTAYKQVYDEYNSNRLAPYNFRNIKVSKVFNVLASSLATKRFGERDADTSCFEGNDWAAHYIMLVMLITVVSHMCPSLARSQTERTLKATIEPGSFYGLPTGLAALRSQQHLTAQTIPTILLRFHRVCPSKVPVQHLRIHNEFCQTNESMRGLILRSAGPTA